MHSRPSGRIPETSWRLSGEEYSPSEQVDIGWHAFLMYTREYANSVRELRDGDSPRTLDIPGVDYGTGNIQRTIAALEVRGMYVDNRLWAKWQTA